MNSCHYHFLCLTISTVFKMSIDFCHPVFSPILKIYRQISCPHSRSVFTYVCMSVFSLQPDCLFLEIVRRQFLLEDIGRMTIVRLLQAASCVEASVHSPTTQSLYTHLFSNDTTAVLLLVSNALMLACTKVQNLIRAHHSTKQHNRIISLQYFTFLKRF